MAAVNNAAQAVDTLVMMFPSIERPRIQEILVNECNNDSTKAIVILSKIEQFNKSMNNVNYVSVNQAGNTGNAGEATQFNQVNQQISLQVIQPQPLQQPIPVQASQDCCGCECCAMKPASYKNGLYRIEFSAIYL